LVLYEIVDNIVNIEKIINSKQEIELLLLRWNQPDNLIDFLGVL
jgi:hypothetical protein